jgi:ABC-type branched-subunit amino acid transport system substrate-binding protein
MKGETMVRSHASRSDASRSDSWRVGVLFSRTGLTAVTETEHFFGTALAIEQINRAGGVLGREIEVVAYDPESDPATYRRLADRLLTEDGISVIFGASSSAQRKAVLPAIERRNGLLWYPSLYEGFEYSPNVIYTGACPNQNSFPLAEYLVRNFGRRVFLVGSDYVYPRESNRIMRDLVESYGGEIVDEVYTAMDATEERLQDLVARIKQQAPNVVFSTVVGRAAQTFYRLYREAGLDPTTLPIASLTMAEGEIQAIGAALCEGHITAASYFASLQGAGNRRFVDDFRRAFGPDRPISMWSAGAYAQIRLFALALQRAGTLDTQRLVEAALGLSFEAPEGTIAIDPDNNHTWLTPRIGRVRRDGGFDVIWEAKAAVKPDPYLAVSPLGARWIGDEVPVS